MSKPIYLDRQTPLTPEQNAAEIERKKANRKRDIHLRQRGLSKDEAIAAMRKQRPTK